MMDEGEDDKVGHRRPPPGNRFQKGASGNPKGRPKRQASSLGAEVEQALAERVEIKEQGRRRKVTKGRAAAKQLANASASGDFRAIKLATQITAKPHGDAPPKLAPISSGEAQIVEQLIARIRQGYVKAEDTDA
jgi:Family of unknown function (DUF5681)